ncbi:NUDIX hydrolase [Owenweeksia hongkongensis]|uniref:NUDIX hydrolase n=1 Tax=Owenweeksia hongkongensis TaxID=253245 RepID=UPI003A94A8DE
MYKVFINDSSISFIEKPISGEVSHLSYESKDQLVESIKSLENSSEIKHLTFEVDSLLEVWNDFTEMYEIIEAAGGIVRNGAGEILMIYRLGKWDLPKGKLEEGESVEEGAVREVIEECGISNLRVIRELPITYHTYEIGGKKILKRTYWFEMHTKFIGDLVPQIEEHIEKAQWVNPDFLDEYMGNTYASIHWLVEASRELMGN